MPREQATRLAAQTCLGAGKMLIESKDDPAQLRENVTSPNGTTHAALVTFEALGFKGIVEKAVKAAVDRSIELGKPLS
jgi:pyrroline-5-carboxylate reductase